MEEIRSRVTQLWGGFERAVGVGALSRSRRLLLIAVFPILGVVCALSPGLAGGAGEVPPCGAGSKQDELCTCEVSQLHPTQLAVGMIEVARKREELAAKSKADLEKYLVKHPEPAVKGPNGGLFITDHHHLGRALSELKVKSTVCKIEADFSQYSGDAFWSKMNERKWVYPYDEKGELRPYSDIPKSVDQLKDDPYRSLAGEVRQQCGYQKNQAYFSEFQWANYFRPKIQIGAEKKSFDSAVKQAVKLAQDKEASQLPGYCGNNCSCDQDQ